MTDYTELKRLATRIVEVQTSQHVPISKLFDDFDAATSPEVVLALIAENEQLREDPSMSAIRSLRSDCADLVADRDQLKASLAWSESDSREQSAEIARLKAENEALRKALMYVRDNADDWHLSEKAADALVDAALSKGEQP